ncbi:MAG: phenylalanine--tRNA ligase subunit alpha [Nanoarchaeota archaeon]
MEEVRIGEQLHALGRKVLPCIDAHTPLAKILQKTALQEIEARRALQWLESKGLVELEEQQRQEIQLGGLGERYRAEGLPERRFLQALGSKEKKLSLLKKETGLSDEEVSISLGTLKKESLITIKKDVELIISLTEAGKQRLEQKSAEELFMEKTFPLSAVATADEAVFAGLRRRKDIIAIKDIKGLSASVTELGKRVQQHMPSGDMTDRLTSQMLKTGSWSQLRFRGYDLNFQVPALYAGRRHFVREAVDYVRRIWLDLGFEEMQGNMVQPGFWNFDALFTAQDHPVRELQDTFYLDRKSALPDPALVKRVKETHENGWTTGSTGWASAWSEEEARKTVLRTHTTVLSAQAIARLKEGDLPKKYFSVGLCFRNETLDWSHLFEFHQSEGIVIAKGVTMKHLIGYLQIFFSKMGYDKVRCRPAYFPYTEPSVEVDVFDEAHGKWLELGGAGIFRPEVVKPLLGKDIPVLAWGLGLARLIPGYYGFEDVRDLNSNDLQQLRECKAWLR